MTIDIESWQAIGGAVAIVATAVWNRLESWKTKKAAQKAVELSRPTGNGFAKKVTDTLEALKKQGDRNEQLLIDHIAAHADHDVASHRPRRILKDVNEL